MNQKQETNDLDPSSNPDSLFYKSGEPDEPEDDTLQINRIGKFYYFLKDTKTIRTVCLWGGAGSGKSQSIVQELTDRFFEEKGIIILTIRKTAPSLRDTTFKMTIDELDSRGLVEGVDYRLNQTTMTIYHESNIWMFRGLDKEAKKKSLNVNYVYIEEATELTKQEYTQLQLRIRKVTPGVSNQMLMSFNPTDPDHWTKLNILDSVSPQIRSLHSTWRDNPFLAQDYLDFLASIEDSQMFQIYSEGNYAVLTNLIYSNYVIEEKFPQGMVPDAYGLDFGFNVQTAMMAIHQDKNNLREFYWREILYQKKMTNTDLIAFLRTEIPDHLRYIPIYADSANPERIQEINEAGFTCYPANKAVLKGIDSVKSIKLHLHKDDENVIKEIRSYKWIVDKFEHVRDEPVKINDHLMDAGRMGTYSYGIGFFEQQDFCPSKWKHSSPLGRAMREDAMNANATTQRIGLPGLGETSVSPMSSGSRGRLPGLF